MLTIAAVSIRNNEDCSITDRTFATVEEVQAWVPGELRGISSYFQVRVYDATGHRVGRLYRSGPNGTGDQWAWEPAPAAPVSPYEDLLAEYAAHMGRLRDLHAKVAEHVNQLADKQPWENRLMFTDIESALRVEFGPGNPTLPVVIAPPAARPTPPCPCKCNGEPGFCGGCGHAGCGRRRR